MTIRYVTVDYAGRLYPVERLLDRFAEPTVEPTEACAAIMQVAANDWREIDPDHVPIYTVH